MMRKILFVLLVIVASLFAAQRVVVMENFTATWCTYCPGQARAMKEIYHRSYDSVTVISYHPSSTSDPFYSSEALARRNYYRSTIGYPTTYFDGALDSLVGGLHDGTIYPSMLPIVRNHLRANSSLDVSLAVTYEEFDRTGTVTAKIKNTSVASQSGTLHFVIVESHIAYAWQDMDSLQYVMRDMLPDANGEAVTIAAGDSVTKSRNFSLPGAWNDDNCDIVVFVQASNKAIYQATASLNPAKALC
jgi:thiol-disulfide isomerase/thioredoxin